MNATWSIPSDAKCLQVNGYPIAYREAGKGIPLVLVHGSLTDYRVWQSNIDVFSAKYRVIAPSLRHYYPEPWDGTGGSFSVQQHAEDLAIFAKTLNLGKVHLLGWSRGGTVVVEVAKHHPEIVRTLILEDGGIEMPVEETPESAAAVAFTTTLIQTLQSNIRLGDIPRAASTFVDALNGPGYWSKLTEARRNVVLDNIYTALADTNRPVTTCDDVKNFDFPLLLLTGEKSPKKYELFYNEMRKCRELPRTIVIPNAGHSMHRDNPDAFNSAVLDFLKRH